MRTVLTLLLLGLLTPIALAQQPKEKEKAKAKAKEPKKVVRPDPTYSDVVYGTHERNKLDFWQAKSDKPTPLVLLIHGGGWSAGDKSTFGTSTIKPLLDSGISVAAINYRYIQQAMNEKIEPPVKGPLMDAARALQFLRSKAKEWNLDQTRVGATGGSAGACTSLWLAFHDDLADPKAEDPILRESTRLQAVAVTGAQTSLDPKQVKAWMPNANYGGHAFGFRNLKKSDRPSEFNGALEAREKILPWIREYSPIELITKDDPPVYLTYPAQDKPPVIGEEQKDPTHSAVYGLEVMKKLEELKIEGVLVYPNSKPSDYKSVTDFLIKKLVK